MRRVLSTRLLSSLVSPWETTLTDFTGARGSNTGDDFHELWATRQAIRLLSNEGGLEAIALEGLNAPDEALMPRDTWDGVDCTQYFGGRDATEATHVRIEQLKYSAADPGRSWSIARMIEGRRGRSVITRLAKAWNGLRTISSPATSVRVVLVSNQSVAQEVLSAVQRAAASSLTIPARKPSATAAPEVRLAYASRLDADEFRAFASALHFEAGAGSRFALEERVLRAIADWTDHDVQVVATGLRQFVRDRMRPEFAGELITCESVLLHLGTSEEATLFPCPSEIASTEAPVSRAPVREAIGMLRSEVQYLCLHGGAGVGKTTALQEIEAALPAGSVMLKYDCYGSGRYLDPSALRHRTRDAFIQLTNELAARLKLPLLLSRYHGSDYPRLFSNRLKHAARALAAQHSGALLVVALDAADNSVRAAKERNPVEPSFVRDFVCLTELPENVRFVVTARTGRRETLQLPRSYCTVEIERFSREETGENVARVWAAPGPWIDDFHHFSGGVPRVQDYAFKVDGAHPSTALDRLRPAGKSLGDIFRQQFDHAITKSGAPAELARLCAALIALPRPVPLSDLAGILDGAEPQLADMCTDLAPGIRVQDGTVSFGDEDFEDFVRAEGEGELESVRVSAAEWLLSHADQDRYAALHVAAALVAAGRGNDLLDLVEAEPAPASVADPVLRREAELQRLRLAIKVCRRAGDVARALRFVLIGAEGVKTEKALRQMLADNPDLAVRFAPETARRLILSDAEHIQDHGPLLFHKLSADADRRDAISYREGRRFLSAWLQARKHHLQNKDAHHHGAWAISVSDISSSVEAALKLSGPVASLRALQAWTPKRIALEVALVLPYRLIAEGRGNDVEAFANDDHLEPFRSFFLLLPLVLAGRKVDLQRLACGLEQLRRRKLRVKRFFATHHASRGEKWTHARVLDAVLTACEVLTLKRVAPELVDRLLAEFLDPELRRIDTLHVHESRELDLLFRAYALREARAGRMPDDKAVFEPRPAPTKEAVRRPSARDAEEHDRPLMELAGSVFGAYATVANALVHRRKDAELEEELRRASGKLRHEIRSIFRAHDADPLRRLAATNLLVLLAAGHAPQMVKRFATEVHGRWLKGGAAPNDPFIARLSLWSSLHSSLWADLAAAADETRTMRMGAGERSATLVSYARLMKPLSEPDAHAIFDTAVEVASELDQEVMAQIRLLDELVGRGIEHFANARATARKLGNIVADAAVRLDGYDDFPWEQAMGALARLDAPLALANAARWGDEALARLWETLPFVLRTALGEGTIRPEQAAALSMLADEGGDVIAEILKQFGQEGHPGFPAVVEEAARDVLIRRAHRAHRAVLRWAEQYGTVGPWSDALIRKERFLAALPPGPPTDENPAPQPDSKLIGPPFEHSLTRETLRDSSLLQEAVEDLWDRMQAEGRRVRGEDILDSAREGVAPADRAAHLTALAGLDGRLAVRGAMRVMLRAIDEWGASPSVHAWCKTELPGVIVSRFPELTRYLAYGEDDLTPALGLTGLEDAEIQELLLEGLERHVDDLGSDLLFKLAGTIGGKLEQSEAVGLVDWYVERLEERIAAEHRDQTVPDSALPRGVDEAAARFLFAYLADCDLRLRWRAAHAVRRLARTGDEATLAALVAEYHRREEPAFRGRDFEFYWLAARLWFALSWDRVAGEKPEIAGRFGSALLEIAFDESFPHLLVRSFARDACEKLVATGHLSLTAKQSSRLASVNESPVPRIPADAAVSTSIGSSLRTGSAYDREVRRFSFNSTDTLPYWYAPMLESFAAVGGERFLQEAERWIVEIWGYSGDLHDFERESRRVRFDHRDWRLTMHSHGSKPTVELLHTHLEWHAMWCAAGELLKTEPLVPRSEDNWHELEERIIREKLVEPPLWSADLLVPTPLLARNWRPDKRPFDDWVLGVREAGHRAEVFPRDVPYCVVVAGSSERRMSNRVEFTRVSSALVEPTTGRSLLRALQTMDDSWDYKIPDEGEERAEIDEVPFRFLGWLQRSHRDESIDEKDPLRGYAFRIDSCPGRRVVGACHLVRDPEGRPRWSDPDAARPMFIHEAWGVAERDEELYRQDSSIAGNRLLADKEQLLDFLCGQGLDLVMEVEVTRRDRKNRRYAGEKESSSPEGRFARLYLLDGQGTLEVAEGRIGTWTGDSPAA